DVLIDSVRLLDGLPLRLTLAGGGPLLAGLRRRARGDDRIRVVGAVESDRVSDLYDAADIFAFPSQLDVFGLVIVEAFAAGLAVAASNAPGAISDLAVPNRNFLLTEEHTPQAWGALLARLGEEAPRGRTLGRTSSRGGRDQGGPHLRGGAHRGTTGLVLDCRPRSGPILHRGRLGGAPGREFHRHPDRPRACRRGPPPPFRPAVE